VSNKLITYDRAKRERERLSRYILLVEEYPTNTLKNWIIKEYAITNSLDEVVRRANEYGFTVDGEKIYRDYVLFVVDSKPEPTDALHKY